MSDAAPKRSSGRGFVLIIIHHTSARGPICVIRIFSMIKNGSGILNATAHCQYLIQGINMISSCSCPQPD